VRLEVRSFITSHDISYRRARATIAEREALAQDTEEALKQKELEAEERRKQSHDLVAESIRRELAESRCLFTCLVIDS
jgi:Microfibril-associated/Pre-mRNA processing